MGRTYPQKCQRNGDDERDDNEVTIATVMTITMTITRITARWRMMVLDLTGSPYPRKMKPSSKPTSTAAWIVRTGRSISPNMASLLPSEPAHNKICNVEALTRSARSVD